MSRYSYAGEFVNPVGTWRVASRTLEDGSEEYFIEVHRSEEREIDGHVGTFTYWSPHTSGQTWSDSDEAQDYMEALEQSYEDDYDEYLEENHDSIVQMERYEQWRNEF